MNNKRDNLNYSQINKGLNNLTRDNILSFIIIGITLLTITGNNTYKKYYKTGLTKFINDARVIYLISLLSALIIYIIFEINNYETLKRKVMSSSNPKPAFIRLVGSVLIVIGTICFIYYQTKEEYPAGGPEV